MKNISHLRKCRHGNCVALTLLISFICTGTTANRNIGLLISHFSCTVATGLHSILQAGAFWTGTFLLIVTTCAEISHFVVWRCCLHYRFHLQDVREMLVESSIAQHCSNPPKSTCAAPVYNLHSHPKQVGYQFENILMLPSTKQYSVPKTSCRMLCFTCC